MLHRKMQIFSGCIAQGWHIHPKHQNPIFLREDISKVRIQKGRKWNDKKYRYFTRVINTMKNIILNITVELNSSKLLPYSKNCVSKVHLESWWYLFFSLLHFPEGHICIIVHIACSSNKGRNQGRWIFHMLDKENLRAS
jgi:hypothetical protein